MAALIFQLLRQKPRNQPWYLPLSHPLYTFKLWPKYQSNPPTPLHLHCHHPGLSHQNFSPTCLLFSPDWSPDSTLHSPTILHARHLLLNEWTNEWMNITNLSLKTLHWLSFTLSWRMKVLETVHRTSMIYPLTYLSCLIPYVSALFASEKINYQW